MPRIPIIDRAAMNAEQGRVHDAAKQAGGPVGGPYYAYIRLPKLYEAAQNMRACLGDGPLSGRERQIAHLVIARHWNSKYPWFAQARASLAVGLEQAVIDAINTRKTPNLTDARERTCYVVARELLANKGLSDETYAAAEKALGLEHLVALVATVGSFSMTCMTAGTFQIAPPADNPTPLAERRTRDPFRQCFPSTRALAKANHLPPAVGRKQLPGYWMPRLSRAAQTTMRRRAR